MRVKGESAQSVVGDTWMARQALSAFFSLALGDLAPAPRAQAAILVAARRRRRAVTATRAIKDRHAHCREWKGGLEGRVQGRVDG